MTDKVKCKQRVGTDGGWYFRQCSRNAWRDGYCKQHHPDTVKEREKKRAERWEAKRKRGVLGLSARLIETREELKKAKAIIRDLLPQAGSAGDKKLCHSGLCSRQECQRCSAIDAAERFVR